MAKGPSKTSSADVQLLTVECAAAYSEICNADANIRAAVFFVEVAVFFVGDAVFLLGGVGNVKTPAKTDVSKSRAGILQKNCNPPRKNCNTTAKKLQQQLQLNCSSGPLVLNAARTCAEICSGVLLRPLCSRRCCPQTPSEGAMRASAGLALCRDGGKASGPSRNARYTLLIREMSTTEKLKHLKHELCHKCRFFTKINKLQTTGL